MPSTKRIAPTVSLTSSFFHRDSDANQTIIWLRSKQRHALNKFYNFTYFFQILRSNMRFQKIPKNTHTVNLYSEFSIAIMSYLWKLDFLFRKSTDRVLWQLKLRILIIFNVKGTFFDKMQQIQFAIRVKKRTENRNRKNRTHAENKRFCITLTGHLRRF